MRTNIVPILLAFDSPNLKELWNSVFLNIKLEKAAQALAGLSPHTDVDAPVSRKAPWNSSPPSQRFPSESKLRSQFPRFHHMIHFHWAYKRTPETKIELSCKFAVYIVRTVVALPFIPSGSTIPIYFLSSDTLLEPSFSCRRQRSS